MVDEQQDGAVATAEPEELLTLSETIDFLGISKQTLYRMQAREELKGIKVGRQWRFRRADLLAYLQRGPLAVTLATVPADELDGQLATLGEALRRLDVTVTDELPAAESVTEAKIALLLDRLIQLALHARASDIHLEPEREVTAMRLRVDGVLQEACRLPKSLHAGVISRLKQLAVMNLEERALPQDGRLHLRQQGRDYDLRISLIPSIFGEVATIRLLDQEAVLISMDHLGFEADDLAHLRGMLARPNGLLLLTGPTGSGKTTTLYSCLQEVAGPTKKTLTIEDPVEYTLPHTVQSQVNVRAGYTFATALRAFLRQDPDIVMVGEIRDTETAGVLMQVALTGHLAFSSLHVADAPSALVRLADMGVEPFVIASALLGVVTQRLVRRLCPQCRQPADHIPPRELEHLRELAIAGGYQIPAETIFQRAVGCPACAMRGYRGRMAVYEVMELTPEVKEAFLNRVPLAELREAAVQSGMCTLAADGIRKAVAGRTTVEEVLRVTC